MSTRFQLRPRDHLGTPEAKQALNREMFTEIAPKYDFITKALSLGRDASWKRHLIAEVPDLAPSFCLDLACGTGDLTRLVSARFPECHVVGLDLTPAMLAIARARTGMKRIAYVEGSMQDLPFEDHRVDLITGGYALRNAPDLDQTLDEIHRVLRPGGMAAFLDFSKPGSLARQSANHLLLKFWGGFWGLALHGNADVYGYIADSLKRYPDRDEVRVRFEARHFRLRKYHRYFGGILESLVFEKRED